MSSERRRALFSLVRAALVVCLMTMALDGGEDCRSTLSCSVSQDGSTATVTDQDGRHRALEAQQAGLARTPVAINRSGQGQPSEILGRQGKVLPQDYPPAASARSQPQKDGSIWGSIKDTIIPSAQAAEPPQRQHVNPFEEIDPDPTVQQQPDNGPPVFVRDTPEQSLKAADEADSRGDYATEVLILRPLAEGGNAVAQFNLGLMYDQGQGVQQNYAEAAKWYRLAAAQGNAGAQLNLGLMYDEGHGVHQDYSEAMKWYRLAAAQGNAGAQFNLGVMYTFGQGVQQNYAEAAKWYLLAAAHGDAHAQFNLGLMYAQGRGVKQNYAEAVKWYRLAAAQGEAGAQANLGVMYDTGHGVATNYVEAVKWYRLAAAQDDAGAQFNLGLMYDDGHGVHQDYSEAVKWYRLAAAQGNAGAQFNLGVMYHEGQGVPQDYVQAHMWMNLCAANATDPQKRHEAIQNRDQVARLMTPAQIAEAQQLARDWKSSAPGQEAATSQPPPQSPPTGHILSGSGFFVSGNGDVLTNAHVVEGCRTAEVTAQGGTAAAQIVARDTGIDLALLKVAERSPATAQLRLTVQQGDSVFAYGFPLTGLLSSGGNFTAGTVTALAGIQDDSRSLQISAPVQPGNSGGPLLDEAGNVVGVVVAKLDALKVARATDDLPQNVNFAIKATVAADFLGAHGVHYTEGKPGPSLPPSSIAERARALAVRIECEQVPPR
jgi:TPR repeat protein